MRYFDGASFTGVSIQGVGSLAAINTYRNLTIAVLKCNNDFPNSVSRGESSEGLGNLRDVIFRDWASLDHTLAV